MLPAGVRFDANGRLYVNAAASPTVNFRSGGFAFTNGGTGNLIPRLCITTAAVAGSAYVSGIRVDSQGRIYGTTTTNAGDSYVGGLRISPTGQLVYAASNPVAYDQGLGKTATGALAVQTTAPP